MISALHIKNIGIIDEINLNLGYGLNILTGETGSGKTLIIDAINILLGGRFSKEMIRKGETYSFVEMSLFLTDVYKRQKGDVPFWFKNKETQPIDKASF